MEIVAKWRKIVVTEHRAGRGGYSAPDHPLFPWYNKEEWDDEGNYYGEPKDMMPVPVSKVTDVTTDTPEIPDWAEPDFEQGVKDLLAKGYSIAATAEELGISKAKVQRLKAKLKLTEYPGPG